MIQKNIDKHGQILLVLDIEFESYWTTLTLEPEEVIELYHEHGTCEQFHRELKTDLDLERFPSGKFSTSDDAPVKNIHMPGLFGKHINLRK